MRNLFIIISIVSSCFRSIAQYAPAAGKPGSTAINKDSTILINWAKQCKVQRGWMNIAQKDSGFVSIGDSTSPVGKAGENGILSLGDSGIAICQFDPPIVDGKGWDFAVFENSFDDRYLELALVEISSDGKRFFRFPCHSLTDTSKQTTAFGFTEPENINNLAGKYRSGYGTPFDIGEIPDYKDLNKNSITHIKIVDVIGSLNPKFASYDTANRKINDPWPTPFPSGGFDLDAIGVIHQQISNNVNAIELNQFIKGPNPIRENETLNLNQNSASPLVIHIYNSIGEIFKIINVSNSAQSISYSDLPSGFFLLRILCQKSVITYKGVKL